MIPHSRESDTKGVSYGQPRGSLEEAHTVRRVHQATGSQLDSGRDAIGFEGAYSTQGERLRASRATTRPGHP